MQLDFTQFATKLERIAELRPIPGSEIVEQYVKAYYLPEPALETWIREHTVSVAVEIYYLFCLEVVNFIA